MARRRLLSDEQLAPLWAWASDERAIVRHYTLSRADLDLIAKKRTASNRLGFAVLMCSMRFPGRVLDAAETPPAAVLAFIADQVGVTPAQFVTYRQRPTNRREHIAELMASLGCRAFDTASSAHCCTFPMQQPSKAARSTICCGKRPHRRTPSHC
jgi:TnpA family transposase